MTTPRCPEPFRTASAARRRAWWQQPDPKKRAEPYRCETCAMWHLPKASDAAPTNDQQGA